jgi:hypothetical protein
VTIGFTGTQKGMTTQQEETVLYLLTPTASAQEEFHHGDCVGADLQAAEIAHGLGYKIISHPPINDSRRGWYEHNDVILPPKEYMLRNEDIADASETMIATPSTYGERNHSGTWATIRRARARKRLIYIVWPDGLYRIEQPDGSVKNGESP